MKRGIPSSNGLFINYRHNKALQKVFNDFRSYYLTGQVRKLNRSLYYGYKNRDLVLLRGKVC